MVSTIKGCTIVDMFIVTILQCIMTHSFVSLDMFVVCVVRYNDDDLKGCTIVNMLIVTVLQCIMTHSFVSLDMFVVCIVRYNDD